MDGFDWPQKADSPKKYAAILPEEIIAGPYALPFGSFLELRLRKEAIMSDDTPEHDNLVPFPPRLRVVPLQPAPALPLEHELALNEHDGRMYDLAPLVQQLSPAELQEISEAAPRSSQEMWDAVVRRWPALAAEIVAGARPAG